MAVACSSCLPAWENPGVILGVILGVFANNRKDKVTVITSPGIWDFGAWLEQLLAESTGTIGKGIIPVDREKVGPQEVYGEDRLFFYIRLDSNPDVQQDKAIESLEKAGHPVVRISVTDPYDLGQEFFRWEMATAVAGSIIGINPFNQPDVEASKVVTRELTTEYENTGSLPPEIPVLKDEGVILFTDTKNESWLAKKVANDKTLPGYLGAHLDRFNSGDYFALLAYIEMSDDNEEKLQTIRHLIRDKKKVATCLGFGPRFLHSTGQAYKGGPNTGVFLQVTCDDHTDLNVPGQKYTFGIIKSAQARGDFSVLSERNRRLLRIHLGPDVKSGLMTLLSAIEKGLA
jgi:transaldolase/glucose-6-phosphate isomerase